MSDEDIVLSLEKREVLGKAVKGLRRDGMVPAVIHNHGQDSIVVMAPYVDITKVYQNAGKHHPVNLNVGKDKYLALIKDVDIEPKKRRVRHVVFNAIRQDQKVEAEIPVHLTEDIPAEKMSLMVLAQLDTVIVEALPKDLPDEILVDASVLVEVGDRITVADIKAPSGVEIMTDPETQIAIVEMPKDQEAEANAAAEALAADADKPAEEEGEAEAAEGTEAAAEGDEKSEE